MMSLKKRDIAIALPVTGEEEWHAVREPLLNGWITQGPKVREFEDKFSARHAVKHALAVSSCTTGLHLALAALKIQPGDEVIVPAFTWVATANAVEYVGAKPVFVDTDPLTFNLDIAKVAEKITQNTKAIMAVHLFGSCVDVDALRAILPSDVKIIEDAACAAGADLRGNPAGSLGDIGVFSFHPRKSITTGEGGMVTTNDEQLAHRMNIMRNHGASISEEQRHNGPQPYLLPEFDVLGFNYRMTDLQGAVGSVQLKKLDKLIDDRAQKAAFYESAFNGLTWLSTPKAPEQSRHGWQAYVTLVNESIGGISRNSIMDQLKEWGVATRPGTHAVHMLGYYAQKYDTKAEDFPVAMTCNNCSMAIPLHNRMTDEDYEYVVSCLTEIDRRIAA